MVALLGFMVVRNVLSLVFLTVWVVVIIILVFAMLVKTDFLVSCAALNVMRTVNKAVTRPLATALEDVVLASMVLLVALSALKIVKILNVIRGQVHVLMAATWDSMANFVTTPVLLHVKLQRVTLILVTALVGVQLDTLEKCVKPYALQTVIWLIVTKILVAVIVGVLLVFMVIIAGNYVLLTVWTDVIRLAVLAQHAKKGSSVRNVSNLVMQIVRVHAIKMMEPATVVAILASMETDAQKSAQRIVKTTVRESRDFVTLVKRDTLATNANISVMKIARMVVTV